MKKQNPTTLIPISLWNLFVSWLWIGGTSFGGGSITHYLIQEYFIYKRPYLTATEYAHILAISQVCPGMNIIAIAILVGKRLGNYIGVAVSLLGLILPSVAITVGISIIYNEFSSFETAQKILKFLFAAIFGVAIATNWRNARPILIQTYHKGLTFLGVCLALMILLGGIYLLWEPPVVLMYILAAALGALGYSLLAKKGESR